MSEITLRMFFIKAKDNWYFIIPTIIFFVVCGHFYAKYQPPIFETQAIIQIQKESSEPIFSPSASIFENQTNLVDEVSKILSTRLLSRVVDKLNLQTKIHREGAIVNTNVNNPPFEVSFLKMDLILKVQVSNKKITISDGSEIYELDSIRKIENNSFNFYPNPKIFENDATYYISTENKVKTINKIKNKLLVLNKNTRSNNLNFIIRGPNKKENELLITTIIDEFILDKINDKRKTINLTSSFLEDRLKYLKKSMDSITNLTIDFKLGNSYFSPEKQTDEALSKSTLYETEISSLSFQLELTKKLIGIINNQRNYNLLPTNLGVNNQIINSQINSYNDLILQRNTLLSGATNKNPLVEQISNQIISLKKNMLKSLSLYVSDLKLEIEENENLVFKQKNQINTIPSLDIDLRNMVRDYEITEQLYIYLLNKKEELDMSYSSTVGNVKIIDNAVSIRLPQSKPIIYLTSFLIGLLIPLFIIFILSLIDNKVRSPEDIALYLPKIPLIGKIPFLEGINLYPTEIEKLSDSFRSFRSSLNFILPNSESSNIIMIGSSLQGEGKTFISYNLGLSYLAMDKKVLLVGADLRNPQLQNINKISNVQKKGLSKILKDSNPTYEQYIDQYSYEEKTLDCIHCGPKPPNPSELILNQNFKRHIAYFRSKYEIIIIDTAPLLLVSDSIPVLEIADTTVLAIKEGVSVKKSLSTLNTLIENSGKSNMCIIYNGSKKESKKNYYYSQSYNS